ncbi:peptidoglycan DD-metalloendopeptidase family protein [Nannocystis sp.]|uniref:M23 family metallopeptidase n=1 Tax=Nannocystis sp. TaxID=1962667 RepID=UPI0025D50CE5|nr:peptidoglycan DD-metalloendopeptidase family protein [Nannocystis sp.]MBK7826581.1 peptidoglycan DD-metalloendopeptidase family protein [Nannocystis sp.]
MSALTALVPRRPARTPPPTSTTTSVWTRHLGLTLLLAACGDAGNNGFSSSNPTGITGASQSTGSSGATASSGDSDVGSTTGPPTTGDTANTSPPCAELTLCPDATTQDPTTSPDSTGDPTQPGTATDNGTTNDTNDTGQPGDPCMGAGDGEYCGAALGGLADHNSVYQCIGGNTVSATPCPAGCENNACKQIAQDPCASAQSGNGKYCGGTLMGGDPGALYNCQNGGTANKQTCKSGCKVNPPGIADACNPEGDPCQGAASGDGPYCGGGLPGGDPNVLYQCVGKATESSETCAEGCQQNPPGVADECKQVQNGGDCCLDTPPGVVTQNYSACGGGGSHYGIDYGTAVGTPIYAGMAGTVVSSALGFPNCYNNGCTQACWNAFNFVKLKADCGDPDNGANDLFIYYLHINDLAPGVGNGTHLDQGQLIAHSGNSGCSSGPHIHIETASVAKGKNAVLNTCDSVNPSSRYCP